MRRLHRAEKYEPMSSAQPQARVFSIELRPLLGDCAPSGRIRLDALARWQQDVAYFDIEDTGLQHVAVWVLRRTRISVSRFPRFGEHCDVQTFCTGVGRMWAQRRTVVTSSDAGGPLATGAAQAPLVEVEALWVHLDPVRKLPSRVTQAELDMFAASAGHRTVGARLHHPRPAAIESEYSWHFRRSDSDLADHVNNAAYWQPLEDELIGSGAELAQIDAEIEFRLPAQPGPKRILVSGDRRWVASQDGEEVYASIVLMNARTTPGSN